MWCKFKPRHRSRLKFKQIFSCICNKLLGREPCLMIAQYSSRVSEAYLWLRLDLAKTKELTWTIIYSQEWLIIRWVLYKINKLIFSRLTLGDCKSSRDRNLFLNKILTLVRILSMVSSNHLPQIKSSTIKTLNLHKVKTEWMTKLL